MSIQKAIPDQLAEIRERIASLKAEEEALRGILISDPSARLGGDYVAMVREVASYRIRGTELEKADPELFAKLARECVVKQVLLARRKD